MNHSFVRSISIGILFLVLSASIGCSKLTPEKIDELRIGMPYEEVVDLLGKPDSCEGAVGFKDCTWGDQKRYINVKFGGNSVVFFSSKGI